MLPDHISQDVEQQSSSCSSTVSFVLVYGNDYQNITENPKYNYYSFRISVDIVYCLPHYIVSFKKFES